MPLLVAFGSQVNLPKDNAASATCINQQYRTEILSVDPLIMHIENFVNDREIDYVMKLG